MKKAIAAVLVLAVLGAAVYFGYSYTSAKRVAARKPMYKTATAKADKIESRISSSGTVEPLNRDTLKAEARATVDEVLVKQNQAVKKGARLVTFKNGANTIKAPYDGIISVVSVKADDDVTAGQELVQIFDNEHFITKINVDELDLPNIKLGQTAQIRVSAFPNAVFSGKVTDIGQEGTAANGVSTFPVTITFDEIGKIKSGMTTEATIVTASKSNVIVVPIEAVRTVNGQKFVTVISDEAAAQDRKVEIGINSTTMVEITKGLSQGEKVQLPQTSSSQSDQLKMTRGFQMQGGQERSGESAGGSSNVNSGGSPGTNTQNPAKSQ